MADDLTTLLGLFAPQWGVFLDGAPVIIADTVADLEYRQEWTISDYPTEDGAFQSFNKVQVPFQGRVRFLAGGSMAARETLLASIEAIAGDLNLYDIATPERVYVNANVIRYDYRRVAQDGVSLLAVDVSLQEVRLADSGGTFNATQAPSGADQSNNGTVQPVTTPANSAGIGAA